MTTDLVTSIAKEDKRPLPLIVAERWNFPLQHYQRFDVDGGYLYAHQDWARGLVAKNPSQALKDFKRSKAFTELVGGVYQLPYQARDGKTYKVDFASEKALFDFAQNIRPKYKTESLTAILAYLSASGVLVDEMRRDPEIALEIGMNADTDAEMLIHAGMDKWRRDGKSEEWIQTRIHGIITRKQFTEALKNAVANAPQSLFSQSTEKLYKGLWKRTTAQLRGDLNLTQKQNIRDHFGRLALTYTDVAEQVATIRLGDVETVDMQTAMEIVYDAAKLISKQAQATSKALGIDLITQRPLLAKGK